MTPQEAAIIMAYTGTIFGDWSTFHKYAQEKLGRPVWTHEFANEKLCEKLKELSRDDFLALNQSVLEQVQK